jgi:hypothetical protein
LTPRVPAKKFKKWAFLAAVVGHVGSRHIGSTQTPDGVGNPSGDGIECWGSRGEDVDVFVAVVVGGVLLDEDVVVDEAIKCLLDDVGGDADDDDDDEWGLFGVRDCRWWWSVCDEGGLILKSIGDVEAIGLFVVDDDESGRSEVVDDLGDSRESFVGRFEEEILLLSADAEVEWLFISSVSILLQARVNIASGSHFSS